jgi:NifU-like protein involved in Fe-S cluster formation
MFTSISQMKLAVAEHKCIVGGFSGHSSMIDTKVLNKVNNPVQLECSTTTEDAFLRAFHDLLSMQKLYIPSYGTSLHALICF